MFSSKENVNIYIEKKNSFNANDTPILNYTKKKVEGLNSGCELKRKILFTRTIHHLQNVNVRM